MVQGQATKMLDGEVQQLVILIGMKFLDGFPLWCILFRKRLDRDGLELLILVDRLEGDHVPREPFHRVSVRL